MPQCRTVDLAGKDPHANGMEISTALKTTSIILYRKLGLDRRPGNGQQPAKSMRDKPELSANRCPAWAARARKGRRQGLDLIIAVGRCFCPNAAPGHESAELTRDTQPPRLAYGLLLVVRSMCRGALPKLSAVPPQ